MAELNETPKSARIHIAFFGLRNAGKSTLVNAFTGQNIAIVSDVAGTTTDPVSKAMEILPLGPCLITDTAGLDDIGELGKMRVEKSLNVLATSDIAVWVVAEDEDKAEARGIKERFKEEVEKRKITLFEYRREDSVEELKKKIAAAKICNAEPRLLDGIATKSTHVICVCPIDESAPKGRLILPQVQLIRECLDIGALASVCQVENLEKLIRRLLNAGEKDILVVTDSQAFRDVKGILAKLNEELQIERTVRLSSFSILFARQKGDLAEFAKGLNSVQTLADDDLVVIAEGCTHHRQCNDIGTVKIPKALEKLSAKKLRFKFLSGGDFAISEAKLIVQCGGCMLTRREMCRRIECAKCANIPILNYGILLGGVAGITLKNNLGEVEY